jgi:hypothetical protein
MMVPLDGLMRVRVIATYDGRELTLDYDGPVAAAIVRAKYRQPSEPIPSQEHDIHRSESVGRHLQPQVAIDLISAS